MIKKLFRLASNERPFAAIIFVICKICDWVRGHLFAKLQGWSKSYLGPSSKIIGTRAITVGDSAYIHRGAWIEAIQNFGVQSFNPSIRIGSGFAASVNLHISAINCIEIGNNCLFGSGVYISDHNHGAYKGSEQSCPDEPPIKRKLISFGPLSIGSNVWLGDNVKIVGSVTIGDGAVIGANSVVTRNVPDNVIAVGTPLRIIKSFNRNNGQWENV